jgi:hypothetical protein
MIREDEIELIWMGNKENKYEEVWVKLNKFIIYK